MQAGKINFIQLLRVNYPKKITDLILLFEVCISIPNLLHLLQYTPLGEVLIEL